MGAKLRPEADLSQKEGKTIYLYLASVQKKVPALVSVTGSDAKKEGNDILFATCSEACAEELKTILNAEIKLFDGVNPL